MSEMREAGLAARCKTSTFLCQAVWPMRFSIDIAHRNFVFSDLAELKVYCFNESQGCESIVERGDLKDHLAKTCAFHLCPHHDAGCTFKGNKAALAAHAKNDCEFESVACPNGALGCKWSGPKRLLKAHLTDECQHVACRHRRDVRLFSRRFDALPHR